MRIVNADSPDILTQLFSQATNRSSLAQTDQISSTLLGDFLNKKAENLENSKNLDGSEKSEQDKKIDQVVKDLWVGNGSKKEYDKNRNGFKFTTKLDALIPNLSLALQNRPYVSNDLTDVSNTTFIGELTRFHRDRQFTSPSVSLNSQTAGAILAGQPPRTTDRARRQTQQKPS